MKIPVVNDIRVKSSDFFARPVLDIVGRPGTVVPTGVGYVRVIAALAAIFLTGCALDSESRQDRATVAPALTRFQAAFQHHSFEELRLVLAPDFRIYGMPPGMSVDGLRVGMQSAAPQTMEIQILSLKRQPDGIDATVGLYEVGKVSELKIGFTPDGRIRSIDSSLRTNATPVHVPDSMISSFVVWHGLMFVRVSVDGRDGWFLVDSGSSCMLLNSRYFHDGGHGVLPGISAGIHGTGRSLGTAGVDDFRWGKFRITGIHASLKDLSGIEGPANSPLLGAIGYAQLKDSAMTIDWQRREIGLFATDGNGSRKIPDPVPPAARLSFDYCYHLPLLHVMIGGRDHPMMLDSGATASLLPDGTGLEGHFHQLGGGLALSDGGAPDREHAQWGFVDEARVGPVVLRNLPVLIYQVPYFGSNGLLGNELLKQGRVEINFRARQILFR